MPERSLHTALSRGKQNCLLFVLNAIRGLPHAADAVGGVEHSSEQQSGAAAALAPTRRSYFRYIDAPALWAMIAKVQGVWM